MSQTQLKKLKVMNAYIDGTIDRKKASELLSLSERQISRIKKGLMTQGETFLIHKNTDRKPAHAISSERKERYFKFIPNPNSKVSISFISKKFSLNSMIFKYHTRLFPVY